MVERYTLSQSSSERASRSPNVANFVQPYFWDALAKDLCIRYQYCNDHDVGLLLRPEFSLFFVFIAACNGIGLGGWSENISHGEL